MNEGSRLVVATVTMAILTLLTALSPALAALAANVVRPAVEMAAKRSQALHRKVCRRLGRAAVAAGKLKQGDA